MDQDTKDIKNNYTLQHFSPSQNHDLIPKYSYIQTLLETITHDTRNRDSFRFETSRIDGC